MRQVPQVALESRDARRLRLLAFQLRDAVAELGRQAVEPPPPPALPVCASAAPDDRRLDDQLFPFPGRPQRAGDHRFLVRVCALRRAHIGRASIVGVLPLVGLYTGPPKHLIARPGVRPSVASPTCPTCPRLNRRHLPERQVFVEPSRREALAGAREQRDEGTPRGIGPPRAAIEVGGNASARAGMLQQAKVLTRRPEEDGHFVERHAARRLVERAPDDFDRFASLPRGREQADVAGAPARRRAIGREDEAAQVRQIGFLPGGIVRDLDRVRRPEAPEGLECRRVSFGHGDEHGRGAPDERAGERALRVRIERHVEQHHRQRRPANLPVVARAGREAEQLGAIGRRGLPQLFLDALEKMTDVARGAITVHQVGDAHACKTQLVDGARQRLRKARCSRDRPEILHLPRRDRTEDRACRRRLRARVGGGCAPDACKVDGRRTGGELCERKPGDPERGAPFGGEAPGQIVGRAARRANDDDFSRRWLRLEEAARLGEPSRRGGGRNNPHQEGPRPDAMPDTARRQRSLPKSNPEISGFGC